MGWTEQQQSAIDARGSSVIVSAAAGSGKTAVLTERLAQLIADPSSGVRADRIIVVTFTNDAAAEMKNRLDHKLSSMIAVTPDNSHLIKQRTLLQNAHISTINAFCFELLRDHVGDIGITAGFGVLDDSDNSMIKSDAVDELINYYTENEYEKISYIYDKFCLNDDKRLASVISDMDNFLSSTAMRDKWLRGARNELSKAPYESVYYTESLKLNMKKLEKALLCMSECEELLDVMFSEESKAEEKFRETAGFDRARIEETVRVCQSGKTPDESKINFCLDFQRLPPCRSTAFADISAKDTFIARRNEIKSLVREVIKDCEAFERDFEETGKVFSILAEMLEKYSKIVWGKKCSRNAISFDDGERLVLDMLAAEDENGNTVQSEIACEISEYFDIIMIDEYQDSNNKQDMIFKLISKEPFTDENGQFRYGSNAFLVGDVKQSIYRFRLANPGNFISTLRHSVPYSADINAINRSVFLNRNFRSSFGVIEYINHLFKAIMSERCGDIEYTENEMLYQGAGEYSEAENYPQRTHFAIINTDIDSDDETSDNLRLVGEFNPEASYTADKIAEMIAGGTPVVRKDGRTRPCRPSDFCILLRKNAPAKQYISELEKRGIAAKGEADKGYLKSREISLLIDVLRIIDNPLLDIPMASVMLSPMFMFTVEELGYIRSLDKKASLYSQICGIVNGIFMQCDDTFFIERCREFLSTIERFRLYSITMTIGELIGTIYDTTDFIAVMLIGTDGEKKRANLRALIQYAKSYEEASAFEGSGGLSGFLRYIDKITDNNGDFAQAKLSASAGEYVTVQTIHKSKGLEYPFVFIAETSLKFRFDSKPAVCTDDGRVGFSLFDQKLVRSYKTSSFNQISAVNRADTVSEEMRLLYVALTRAKQQLFINLNAGSKKLAHVRTLAAQHIANGESFSETASNAVCLSDWLWLGLMQLRCFAGINEEFEIVGVLPQISEEQIEVTYEITNGMPSDKEVTKQETVYAEPDMDVYETVKNNMRSRYDYSMSELPAKLSVTEVTKKFKGTADSFDFKLKRPSFISETSRLTGSERGTAIHTFFQYCDFNTALSDPESAIEKVTLDGYISREQAESINTENVSAFFRSELYKRISDADNIWREKKFMVAVSELDIDSSVMSIFRKSDGMIKGIVDLLFQEDNELVIVDYKSDRNASVKQLAERYKVQLSLYKSAIELTTGMNVREAYLYSFELRRSIKINI